MKWHEGETLVLRLNGQDLLRRPEFSDLPYIETVNKPENGHKHVVHTGGKYNSHLLLPVTNGHIR